MDDLARALDRACVGASSFFDIGAAVEGEARGTGHAATREDPWAPFVAAFRYDFAERHDPRRDEFGPFVPMIQTAEYSFPPRLGAVTEHVKAAWLDAVARVREAGARARLNDLLWESSYGGNPHVYARAAVAAYTQLAARWVDLDRTYALGRALEISLRLRDTEAAADLGDRIATAAQQALEEADQKPGVALRLIQLLVEMADPPGAVDDLLAEAAARYRDNVPIGDSVTDMLVSRARGDQTRVDELRRAQLERWMAYARASDGLVAVAHLQHGLELARTYGLSDEADDFRMALQNFNRDSIEFERIEAEASVDSGAIEELVESLVGNDWPSSLRAFGGMGPPTGDVAGNAEFVRDLMRAHPVGFLFTRTILGPENTVIKNIAGDEAHFTAQLAEHEASTIMFWSQLAAEGLRRMQERHGTPDTDLLMSYFSQGVIAPEYAEAFARAVRLYSEERYDECAMVVVPRIEGVVRELARRAGLIVVREPYGERPGGVRSLGETLLALRGVLGDESWWRYLWNALAEPLGLNLRNRLAHGLTAGTQLTAAVLLHISSFVALLRPKD
jgi:Domain of unknown function (DUF4209)